MNCLRGLPRRPHPADSAFLRHLAPRPGCVYFLPISAANPLAQLVLRWKQRDGAGFGPFEYCRRPAVAINQVQREAEIHLASDVFGAGGAGENRVVAALAFLERRLRDSFRGNRRLPEAFHHVGQDAGGYEQQGKLDQKAQDLDFAQIGHDWTLFESFIAVATRRPDALGNCDRFFSLKSRGD
jgi:hypothetical protein